MPRFELNPLKEMLLDEGASLMPYGVEPAEPGAVRRVEEGEDAAEVPLLAAAFGPIELEYASLRTDCVVMDRPDRAVVEVSGADARDFLGRMLTQDVAGLGAGSSCDSFWLNRKGRIDADVRVMRLQGGASEFSAACFYLEMERGSVEVLLRTLGAYIITEEVRLAARPDLHRLSLHGPRAGELLRACGVSGADLEALRPDANEWSEIPAGVGCRIDRRDSAGVPGYELCIPVDAAGRVYELMLRVGRPGFMGREAAAGDPGARGAALAAARGVGGAEGPSAPEAIRLRACGWFAYNIARIEAGTPLFKIDFGPENLPAESGVIEDRVNFKKGCYLGQEIVARMHARGHPKQRLVALRFEDDLPPGPDGLPPLPVQGDRVVVAESGGEGAGSKEEPARAVGSITSSTFSPMLGRVPVAFAMVGYAHTAAGTRVLVESDGARIGAVVQEGLRLVPG